DEPAAAARRIRLEPSSASGNFLVLPAAPDQARRTSAGLCPAILASMARAATSDGTRSRASGFGGHDGHGCDRGAMNSPQRRPFLAWPGWSHLRFAWLLTLLVIVWFGFVYLRANAITTHRTARVRVHLDAELHLPLVPAFTIVYMSLYLLFLA